jgi:hypothetical protein
MRAGDTGQQPAGEAKPGASRPGRRFVPAALLEFRPWMLALAVFLACAIGIAIMERSRDDGAMWAQAPLGHAAHR